MGKGRKKANKKKMAAEETKGKGSSGADKDDEEVLDWGDLNTSDITDTQELMRDVLEQAWKDGKVTEDERGLLDVLRKRLGVSDRDYNELLAEFGTRSSQDTATISRVDTAGQAVESTDVEEAQPPNSNLGDNLSREGEKAEPPPAQQTSGGPDMGTVGRPTDIITLRTSVRGERPLSHSFDLDHRGPMDVEVRKCPSCMAQIKVRPYQELARCPLCGAKVVAQSKEPEGLRKVLDMAKVAYRDGKMPLAKELYSTVLATSPGNKEALFYMQKMGSGGKSQHRADISSIRTITLGNQRLDALLKGGIEVGSQILIKGPSFCGKDLVVDALLASSLKKGLPVIYVSSNRAMKEVVRGITEALPEFRDYNRDGMVRMFDLFSRHSDDIVLKEGHRIFNIHDKSDFLRFQNDLIMVIEEIRRTHGGGVLIISSLSPLINNADHTDLMKFLQVLIARSKSYNFTNLYDLAANVHPEEITNSVEYLMDGIAEFREKDGKYSLRLKGFKQGVVSKDWIDYSCSGRNLVLTSSFHEQRIL